MSVPHLTTYLSLHPSGHCTLQCPIQEHTNTHIHSHTLTSLDILSAGLGWALASRRFLEVIGMVWAGSQVTKLPRAAAALALAPAADAGLGAVQRSLRLGSKRSAFLVVLLACIGGALALFAAAVCAWA